MNKGQKITLLLILFTIFILAMMIYFIQQFKEQKTTAENLISNSVIEENYINDIYYNEEWNRETNNEISTKLSDVTSRASYFTINALYNNYIDWMGYQNKEYLKDILSPQYIAKYNITDDNIFNKLTVPKIENNYQYYKTIITEMISAQVDDTTDIYIVKGNCRIVGKDTRFSVQALIEIDTTNCLYAIYPYQYMKDNGYDKLKIGDTIHFAAEKVEKNNNNKFSYIVKNDQEMANEYFDNFRELIQNYPEEVYNRLNTEYRQKRFENKENFETYLKDNQFIISIMTIDKYKVNPYQNYTDYICSDKYNNFYVFRQEGGIMQYSIFLDNYTIMQNEDIETYNQLDKKEKGRYNLFKFGKQLNTKDYAAIYNSLDSTFKENHLKTQNDLKEYIQNNLYDLNEIEIEEVDDETYEYYIFKCKVSNMKNKEENKTMTFIINQEESDYTMSFSIE